MVYTQHGTLKGREKEEERDRGGDKIPTKVVY
jgi:hypothetical protein